MKQLILSMILGAAFLLVAPSPVQAQISGYALDTITASDTLPQYQLGEELQDSRLGRFSKSGDFEYYAVKDSLSGACQATVTLKYSLDGTLWRTDTTFILNGAADQTFRIIRRDWTAQYWKTEVISPSGTQSTKFEQEWIWKEEED